MIFTTVGNVAVIPSDPLNGRVAPQTYNNIQGKIVINENHAARIYLNFRGSIII